MGLTDNETSNRKYVMGPMNGPEDKHPATIIATCYILKTPLPEHAKCKNQPSKYIKKGAFDGKLDTIIDLLGDKMPDIPLEQLEKYYKSFRWKYKSQKNIDFNNVNLTVYFCDWLLFARNRGFSHNDYFDFELYNKESDVRDTFLDEEYRLHIYKVCAEQGYRDIFRDKPVFNQTFADFVHRDWVNGSTCTFSEFVTFAEKHDSFFAKPINRTGGKGARIIKRNSDTLENLYSLCKQEQFLLEEIVEQHESLAAFNDSTLNTIRILTILPEDNQPRILLAVGRFGRAGNVVDNFHGGGVGAIVDVETGEIISEAINREHLRSSVHPDSNKEILGFKYPFWNKVRETVCQAALVVPQVRNVGWDVTITKDGEVEIIEGNSRSGFDVLQSPDQVGRKYLYEPYLPALEEKKGIYPCVYQPLEIDIKGMEKKTNNIKWKNIKRKLKKLLSKI